MVKMILAFKAASTVLIVGVGLIMLAPRIGTWIYLFNDEIRRNVSDSPESKSWRFLTSYLGLEVGPILFIWLIRLVGIGFAASSTFVFVAILSF
jgi:hypothetical protein